MGGPHVYVAVCGPGRANEQEEAWAEAVGRAVAEAGAVVLTGGLGGVMDAASRGATTGGGVSIGILPDGGRGRGSPNHTFTIPTGLGEVRNAILVRAADVVIAISGEFGTLSEIAFALRMGIPVVGLHTWELGKRGRPVHALEEADDPRDAVRRALRLAAGANPAEPSG